jgi:type I restriction-modification system DNA methylase subunit
MKEFSEANVRANFIDPLFKILGWKTDDMNEYSRESYIQDVGFADIEIKLDGEPKVFIEAKRFGGIPHIKKRGDADWTMEERQVILYAASRNCRWAVLTNFEKLRVYNALTGLTILNFESVYDLTDRFRELLYLTKHSVETGRIEKLADKEEKSDIDIEFLKLLNNWRISLANDIYQRNKDNGVLKDDNGELDLEKLKDAVQRILDRIVIIRWAEDNLVVDDPYLLGRKLDEWKVSPSYNSIVDSLFAQRALFDKFDKIHDGKIFERGHICEQVEIGDEVLGGIIQEMNQRSFRKFDFDILGNTYETYLGNTLYLKDDGTLGLKPGMESRKESGIYYTPPYVVDYIVQNTLGELLKDKTPEEVSKIKVLDPACGSGSFLIKAYDYFKDYYEGENEKIHQQKERLIEEIRQANGSQMNFENNKTYEFKEYRGFVISGSEEDLIKYFGDEWRTKTSINWREEFKDAFGSASNNRDNGFDVIIGNPPYIRVDVLSKSDKKYWQDHFESPYGKYDIYFLFIEMGIKLLKSGGRLGFIVSNKFLVADYGKKLRDFILENCIIEKIIDASNIDVFKDASIYPVIIILRKEPTEAKRISAIVKSTEIQNTDDFIKGNYLESSIPQKVFYEFKDKFILINLTQQKLDILQKVDKNSELLSEYCIISEGLHTGGDDKFIIQNIKPDARKVLRGRDVIRYGLLNSDNYIDMEKFREFFPKITPREQKLDEDKIVIQEFALRPTASIDYDRSFCLGTIYFATPKKEINLKYLLGILNSQLLNYLYRMLFDITHMRGGYIKFRSNYLGQMPIHSIDFSNPSEKSIHDDLVTLVDRMHSLNEQLMEFPADFWHYVNLQPHNMIALRGFIDALPANDKEALKDHFGKPLSTIKSEKFEGFEVVEEGDQLIFNVGYRYKGSKGKIMSAANVKALRLRIPDEKMRKFILYSLKDTTPGKLGRGNVLKQIYKLKIPQFAKDMKENAGVIQEVMTPFLEEVAKREDLDNQITETDRTIDQMVYELYELTEKEIAIVEESMAN